MWTQVKVHKKTLVALDLQRENPRGSGWNVVSLDGRYHYLSLEMEVIEELIRRGADLNDPDSIHNVILQVIDQ